MRGPVTLTTRSLILRPFRSADAPSVRALAGQWEVARMTDIIPHPYPEGVAEQWIATHDHKHAQGADHIFAITRDDQCIGSIALESDIKKGATGGTAVLGYWLGLPYWGQGFASEAVGAVIALAFGKLDKPCLISDCFADNLASRRVLAKMGFIEGGHGTMQSVARGCEVPSVSLALTRDDWRAKQV